MSLLPPTEGFDFRDGDAVPDARELDRVHLIAIGGSGMSAVARLLLARGTEVSGSDAGDSATLRALEAEGARVSVGHAAENLGAARVVVVSSAIRADNVELRAARDRGLPVLHRAQALASLMGEGRGLAVAGANGKTTTSAMAAHVLRRAGLDPAFAIGSQVADLGVNAAPGGGPGAPFVVEADESDGSFLVYRPEVAVVTNIAADHLDHYGDVAAIEEAFAAFADTLPADGLLITNADDAACRRLAEHVAGRGRRVLTFGHAGSADLVLGRARSHGLSWSSTLTGPVVDAAGNPSGVDLRLPVPGEHNLANAAAVVLAAHAGFDLDLTTVVEALADFPGTRRRFEAVGVARGVQVVDDYAHNPDKVAAVVRTARVLADEHGRRRLVVVFQPHLYTRTRDFAAEFARALAPADVVVLLEIYAAREDPLPGVDARLITAAADPGARIVDDAATEDVPGLVARLVEPGDLVLTVGAGDVTTLGPRIVLALESTGGPE